MKSGGVLVLGCSDTLPNTGLNADKKIISALQVPVATVSTSSASRNAEDHIEPAVETASTVVRAHLDDALRSMECKVVKLGAMFSEEAVKMASEILQRNGADVLSVFDAEPFFKTESSPPKPHVVAALRRDVLPSITLLSATVPEVIGLLEDAGIPAGYPRGIPDVQALAKTLAQKLGPQYVMIKREFIDEEDGATTLHYVLISGAADAGPPVMETFRFENPKRMFGASYFVPPAIAAYLAKGQSVPEAVSAGFGFIGTMLKAGDLFD